MVRSSAVIGMAVLGLALLVGTGYTGGTKKGKGQLPSGWGKLGLSKDQKSKIYAIQAEYKTKIQDLEKQLDDLRAQQRSQMVKVLTEEQKDKLRKLATGETTSPRTKEKNK